MKLFLVHFVSICFLCVGSESANDPGEGRRPNIILVMADDYGMDAHQAFPTPEIDNMAAKGMFFTFVQSTPLCTPSRVQIMTGKYNFRNYEQFGHLNPKETTFAHLMKAAGYRTCIAGKWQLGRNIYGPYKAGFDEYCLWHIASTGYRERYHNPRVVENGNVTKYSNGEYGPRIYTDYILDFIERNRNNPFFVYFPMALTHKPFAPTPDTEGYRGMVTSRNSNVGSDPRYFDDQVLYMDRIMGEIVQKVEALGIERNTLILFTGDNGTHSDILFRTDGEEIPGYKGKTELMGTHVPLVAYWSGTIRPGSKNHNLIDFTDFLPTFAEAAGADLPEDFLTDGVSFLPQLKGKPSRTRSWVFCHYDPGKSDRRITRFLYNKVWKLYGDGRFYNILRDPLEETAVSLQSLSEEERAFHEDFARVLEQMH